MRFSVQLYPSTMQIVTRAYLICDFQFYEMENQCTSKMYENLVWSTLFSEFILIFNTSHEFSNVSQFLLNCHKIYASTYIKIWYPDFSHCRDHKKVAIWSKILAWNEKSIECDYTSAYRLYNSGLRIHEDTHQLT